MDIIGKELLEKLEDSGQVRSVELLRSDMKNYNRLKEELATCEQEYAKNVAELKGKIIKAEEELGKVKSPGYGDGLGGYVEPLDSKTHRLLEEKKQAIQDLMVFMSDVNSNYNNRRWVLMARISNVDKALANMTEDDKEFITDLYIKPIGFKKVMKDYKIENNGHVYRKATEILKKVL